MREEMFSLPEALTARLNRDYLLSVARLVADRTPDPLDFVMEMDALVDAPPEQRMDRFRALLANFEGRLSAPIRQSDEGSGTVYL